MNNSISVAIQGILGFIRLIGILLLWAFSGHAANEPDFDRVSLGMTQAEVLSILGEPSYKRGEWWGYRSKFPLKWCGMEISFSPKGLVDSKFHDH